MQPGPAPALLPVPVRGSVDSSTSSPPNLPGVLLDHLTEALLHAPGPTSRALVVMTLIGEIHDTAQWILDDPSSAEMVSLAQILSEAQAHRTRMSEPEPVTDLAVVRSARTDMIDNAIDANVAVAIMSA